MPNEDHAIEQNELLFLEHHRSAVQDLGFGKLFVSSDRTVKTWNFIGAITGDVDLALCEEIFADWKMTPCFKVTPWTPPAVETQLQAAGWSPAVTLTHMVHATGEIAAPPDVAVRRCETPDDIRIFSDVQSVAFGAPAWISWVLKVNLVNLPRPNQRFYLAELDGKTVGVLLLVLDGAVGGLYAVATLPDVRRRGVSRALVARAIRDARVADATTICLNTLKGGPAEPVFARLGFEHRFDSKFYG